LTVHAEKSRQLRLNYCPSRPSDALPNKNLQLGSTPGILEVAVESSSDATSQGIANEEDPRDDDQAAHDGDSDRREYLCRFAADGILKLTCLFEDHSFLLTDGENATEESKTLSVKISFSLLVVV
jgi:hypothetical protein